jgi:hypothetical protein
MVVMENNNQRESTIVVKYTTRERLRKLGYKGQTYDEIITKLLDSRENKIDSLDHGVGVLQSSESSYNS